MSDDANYEELLHQSWDAIPETIVLPTGSWKVRLRNAKFLPATEKQGAKVLFRYTALEPMEDVNEEQLAAMEKDGKPYDYGQNRLFFNIWVEDAGDWQNVKKHLAKHGNDVIEGKNITESFKAARGKEVISYLDQRTYTNGAGDLVTENTLGQFVPVED